MDIRLLKSKLNPVMFLFIQGYVTTSATCENHNFVKIKLNIFKNYFSETSASCTCATLM